MKIKDSVVFITGANRGLGLAFAKEALARGAKRVYAAARDPSTIKLEGVVPVKLDVTDAAQVAAAAQACGDVTFVINNAGIADFGGFLTDPSLDSARRQLETNFFGLVRVSQAFAPVLAAHGGGALLNILSIASWINRPALGTYGATKSAAWAATNGLRHELREQGTLVSGLHVGFIDTDLTTGIDAPKLTPAEVVNTALDGIEAGIEEILADDNTRKVKASLSSPQAAYLAA
ncbi:SDR family oxidoreductase [Variovorax sp. VNK109]|jgi:NAD(P)-dependent dehydrogenase (short-subunit alcohol dehydrogenase family)|uniref:SDR family oxidoreductase n=1 Tax=Variovorax sp. VNK109 TaxID=3400919 RepID=UPI003C034E2F